jgi:hypothetical protein
MWNVCGVQNSLGAVVAVVVVDGDGSGGGDAEAGQKISWECGERNKFLYCHVGKEA